MNTYLMNQNSGANGNVTMPGSPLSVVTLIGGVGSVPASNVLAALAQGWTMMIQMRPPGGGNGPVSLPSLYSNVPGPVYTMTNGIVSVDALYVPTAQQLGWTIMAGQDWWPAVATKTTFDPIKGTAQTPTSPAAFNNLLQTWTPQ